MIPHHSPCFVIVVHHGSTIVTEQILHALLTNSVVPNHIIIIDHGHPAPPLKLRELPHPAVTLLRPSTNTGYGAGILLGLGALLRHSITPHQDLVLCVNNDVVLGPEVISGLRTWWYRQPPGLLAGIRYGYINLLTGRAHATPPPYVPSRPFLHGAALAGTVSDLARHLPSDYFLYSEDVALSWRAQKKGLRLQPFPLSLAITHDDEPTILSDQKLYYLVRNGAYVLEQEASLFWRIYWQLGNRLRRQYHDRHRHHLISRALLAAEERRKS